MTSRCTPTDRCGSPIQAGESRAITRGTRRSKKRLPRRCRHRRGITGDRWEGPSGSDGICFSPDESRLFVVDIGHIRLFDMNGTTPVNGRVFVEMRPGGSRRRRPRLRERAPHHQTFPVRDSRWKQERAFASHHSRDGTLLKEDKEGLCGHPGDQQESDRDDAQHYERPEMMIIRLAAHRALFFHATRWYQPERVGGLHRKKKETYRGTISSLTEQA